MSAITFFGSIAAAASLMTAGAATARQPAPIAAPAPAPSATSNPNSLHQRYCIVEDVTGSRIRQRACASLAEWQVRGVDPRTMRRVSGSRSPFGQ